MDSFDLGACVVATEPDPFAMNKPIRFAVVLVAICACATRASGQERLTFSRDVAPVLFKHCVSCHRPGQTAPFSLLTFEDVRPRAARIADVTRARVMPPWKPDPGHGRFQDERRIDRCRNRCDPGMGGARDDARRRRRSAPAAGIFRRVAARDARRRRRRCPKRTCCRRSGTMSFAAS